MGLWTLPLSFKTTLLIRAQNTCLPIHHRTLRTSIRLPVYEPDWQGDRSEKALTTFHFATHSAMRRPFPQAQPARAKERKKEPRITQNLAKKREAKFLRSY